jgi:hypothetical protein
MSNEMAKLKNGTEVPKNLAVTVSISVEKLFDKSPIAAYELVMLCRDANHRPFGKTGKDLQDLALMDPSGRVHQAIRDIVLSGASGEGLGMTWTNPIAH